MITFEAIDAASPGKSLAAALQAFERKHGVHLTLHDCRGIFYHADGTPFFPGRYMHIHPYCITGRFETPGWNRRCHEECMLRAEAAADRLRRPFLHSCWKGVTELIVPLERNGSLALLLYAGAFRTPGTELPEELPEEVADMLRRMLATDPGERCSDTALLARDLEYFIYKDGYGPTIVTLADYMRRLMPGRFGIEPAGPETIGDSDRTVVITPQ